MKGLEESECKLAVWVGLYQMGIKVEFGGFIGGFGKIFFTKGGIKRDFGMFLGWRNRKWEFLGYVWRATIY